MEEKMLVADAALPDERLAQGELPLEHGPRARGQHDAPVLVDLGSVAIGGPSCRRRT
jgi:hypothetical protein